jgi:hypothetical protein
MNSTSINLNFEISNLNISSSSSSSSSPSTSTSSLENSSINNLSTCSSVSISTNSIKTESIAFTTLSQISNGYSLDTQRDNYSKLISLKNHLEYFKTNLCLNEIKNEVNNLMNKLKSDLKIDVQTKFTELLYEQSVLNAKLATIECLINSARVY